MKRITLLTLVTICLFTYCTKSSAPTEAVDEAALSAVMSSTNNNQLVHAYALLRPVEKLELWSRHIKYFIQSHNLSSEQSAFVMDFKNQWVIKNMFEENSTVLNKFTVALPQIKYKAQSLLGVPDAFALLIDLFSDRGHYMTSVASGLTTSSPVHKDVQGNPGGDPGGGDCHCSQTDPYCNTGTCRDNGCTTGSGCGTLWLYKCNGVCFLL
jgi:hypothetical protein